MEYFWGLANEPNQEPSTIDPCVFLREVAAKLTVFLVLLCDVSPLRASSTFESLSEPIVKDIGNQKNQGIFPRVAVIDLPEPSGGIANSSSFLADDLSTVLEAKLPPGSRAPCPTAPSYSGPVDRE
jgi:hypothetical protein